MPDKPRNDTPSELFPIRTVAGLTGVNAVTLRAWERRYDLLHPRRTDTGHRLYSRDDIDLIQKVVALLDRGVAISQIKHQLVSPADTPQPGPWSAYQQRMLNAISRFDYRGLENSYHEALSLYPVDVVTQHLILPLVRELGQRWERDEASIAEEHFFGVYLRNKLGARYHHEAAHASGPVMIAACLPGEYHETALLLTALSAMVHGFRVVLLGADTPLKELRTPARLTDARAIVLSGALTPAKQVLEFDLPALVMATRISVYVGGPVAVRHHDAIVRAGAIPLGTEIVPAIKRMREQLLRREH